MTTTPTQNPVAVAFAGILATIHTAHLAGEERSRDALLDHLDTAMRAPELGAIYYSSEVDDYVDLAGAVLYGGQGDEIRALLDRLQDEDTEDGMPTEEELQAIADYFNGLDESEAFKAPELRTGVCGNPDCGCAAPDDEEVVSPEVETYTDAEIISENDDHMIVMIYKK